jgi:hypothetical protein
MAIPLPISTLNHGIRLNDLSRPSNLKFTNFQGRGPGYPLYPPYRTDARFYPYRISSQYFISVDENR